MITKQIQIEIRKHLNIIANSTDKINILNNMLKEQDITFHDMGILMNESTIEIDTQQQNDIEELFN